MSLRKKPAWAIDLSIVEKAALVYARGKWGDVVLGEPSVVFGIPSKYPRAYVFPVGLNAKKPNMKNSENAVEEKMAGFIEKYKAVLAFHKPGREKKGTAQTIRAEFDKCRRNLVFSKTIGTIVVSASKETHPVMMAYEGLPFSITAPRIIARLEGSPRKKTAATAPALFMDDRGGPIFFQVVKKTGARKLVSVFDFRTQFARREKKTVNPLVPVEKKRNPRLLWAFIARLKGAYVKKISPAYIGVAKTRHSVSNSIAGVPDLTWHNGCAPTAAGNILAYWDDHGYGRLVDEPGRDEYDLIDQLHTAMDTDSSGSTKDSDVNDGIEAVCNDAGYANNYDFSAGDSSGWYVWGKIKDEINAGRPSHLIVHDHSTYGDHSVTVVGYREVDRGCSADDKFVTIHDTWSSTGRDVEIGYGGSVNGYDGDWRIVPVHPGYASRSKMLTCASKDAAFMATERAQRELAKALCSPRLAGAFPRSYRAFYKDRASIDEFNMILSNDRILLQEFGRQLNIANVIVNEIVTPRGSREIIYPRTAANSMSNVLTAIAKKGTKRLKTYLMELAKEIKKLGGKNGKSAYAEWVNRK